VKLFRFRIL